MAKYYHITKKNVNTIKSILSNGLICDEEGYIFLFENKSIEINGVINTIADIIAAEQLFLDVYVMFEIDSKGIISELIPDNVAEYSSKFQWIAKQPKIDCKYINIFGGYKNEFKPFYTIENLSNIGL